MTRYALYFAPAPDSLWWQAGCHWLGRDALTGSECLQPAISGLPRLWFTKLTSDARRYGFHATLKAPFRLANGFTETHLLAMAERFCAFQARVPVGPVTVGRLGASLVLKPSHPTDDLDALAMRSVSYFDLLRAPPKEEELKKYRDRRLTVRQAALLKRWGYPYTEEEFQFHLTLTDGLSDVPPEVVKKIEDAARRQFAKPQAVEPLTIDALSIFREDQPGSPFVLWHKVPFNADVVQPSLPREGRLFYVTGATGAGRNALLEWLRRHMPVDRDIVFARRTITRVAHASEPHEPVDEATFWQLAQDGHFAMMWRVNDLCYGVRRAIEVDLKLGRDVIVNGSREYVPQLQAAFPQAQIVWLENDDAPMRDGVDAAGPSKVLEASPSSHRSRQPKELASGNLLRMNTGGSTSEAGQQLLSLLAR